MDLKAIMRDKASRGMTLTRGELVLATGLSERQLRHYIQIGTIDRHAGPAKAPHYTLRHIQQADETRKYIAEQIPLARLADKRADTASAKRHRGPPSDWASSIASQTMKLSEHLVVLSLGTLSPQEKLLRREIRLLAWEMLVEASSRGHTVNGDRLPIARTQGPKRRR